LPYIFERFYRSDTSRSKSQAEGYGLGLAIAKKISDSLNGSIEVTSAAGKGSTFTITLPTA
jgi:signal transduction histidine kinase